ncbi:unnamed protein product [marine sediment metagenome]|uniref:Uncharacterized protein n=1 Tax=marine sediment metagenome TaxID=412755 RepID=X0ZG38_9ZZZZ
MNSEKHDNFLDSLNLLQQKIEVFRRKKKELNKYIKEYIASFQMIESEFNNSFSATKDIYNKKGDYCNKKIKKLRNKRIEYKHLLDNLFEEKKNLQKLKPNDKDLKLINSINNSIKQIERKIHNLEGIIKTEILDINEENNIVEKIRELEGKKQEQLGALAKKEQEQIETRQNNEFYKNLRKIKIVEVKLRRIHEQLNKWSNKKRNYHIKMLDLYRKAKELKDNPKKMEEELIKNKNVANSYHLHFINVLNLKNKISMRRKPRKKQIISPLMRLSIEKRKMIKKLKQEKLAIALEKQKSGKKLDIHEFRLILE